MSKRLLELAAASAAASAALIAELANGGSEESSETTEETPRRGRPPGSGKKETKAEPEPQVEGLTMEELQELIAPLVKDKKGAEVKAAIKKYTKNDEGLKALVKLPQHHEDFKADIEALSM